MEQEEYTKEQIDWSYIEFVDNQDVLDLIEKVSSLSVNFSNLFYVNLINHSFGSLVNSLVYHKLMTNAKTSLFYFYLQKPGGIIALLDEAWYHTFPLSSLSFLEDI